MRAPVLDGRLAGGNGVSFGCTHFFITHSFPVQHVNTRADNQLDAGERNRVGISVAGIELAATFVAASLAENSAVEPIIAIMPRRLALD